MSSVAVAPLRRRIPGSAVLFTALAAVAFLVIRPPVGDFWAAEARHYAVMHGVGLHYWFAWFGGTVPGHYSVLAPFMLEVVGAGVLGAAATVASVLLCMRILSTTTHTTAAAWLAAVAASFSLWSGRIPFAAGTALMLAGVFAVAKNRPYFAAALGILTTLVSPVSGAFLALGVLGVIVHDGTRRRSAIAAAGGAGCSLLVLGGYFGLPGSEGFPPTHAALAVATTLLLLAARPPAFLRTVVLVSAAACVVLAVVPNGLGTNFERFTWICLPVAVVATGGARRRLVYGSAAIAVLMGVLGSAHDLYVAAQPMSSPDYSAGLARRLDEIPNLADYRVEVVADGTHVAAYTLLPHAALARGYETQSDNRLNPVLMSSKINAASYRAWLDDNAVAYVALDERTLSHNPEDKLVRSGSLPYLVPLWSDGRWRLYAVSTPKPIATPPSRVVDAEQADIVISVPRPGRYELRLRWSRFLTIDHNPAGARLESSPDGTRTELIVTRAGTYTLTA